MVLIIFKLKQNSPIMNTNSSPLNSFSQSSFPQLCNLHPGRTDLDFDKFRSRLGADSEPIIGRIGNNAVGRFYYRIGADSAEHRSTTFGAESDPIRTTESAPLRTTESAPIRPNIGLRHSEQNQILFGRPNIGPRHSEQNQIIFGRPNRIRFGSQVRTTESAPLRTTESADSAEHRSTKFGAE